MTILLLLVALLSVVAADWTDFLHTIGQRQKWCDSKIFQSGYMKLGLCSPLLGSMINGLFKNANITMGPCSTPCRVLGCSLLAMGCADEYRDVAEDTVSCPAAEGGELDCARHLSIGETCQTMADLLWVPDNRKLPLDLQNLISWQFLLQQVLLCESHEDTTIGLLLDLVNGPLISKGSKTFLTPLIDWLKENRGPCSPFCRGITCGLNLIGCQAAVAPIIEHINDHHASTPCAAGDLACGDFVTPAPTPPPSECTNFQCQSAPARCDTPDKPWLRLRSADPTADTIEKRCCSFCEDPCVADTCVDKTDAQCALEGQSAVSGTAFVARREPKFACCKTCHDQCQGLACATPTCGPGEELRFVPGRCCPQCLHPCQDRECPANEPKKPQDCPAGSQLIEACKTKDPTGNFQLCEPPNCCNQCQNGAGLAVQPNTGAGDEWWLETWFIAVLSAIVVAVLLVIGVVCLLCFLSRRRSAAGGRRGRSRSRAGTAGGRSMRGHSHRSMRSHRSANAGRDYDALANEALHETAGGGMNTSPYADVSSVAGGPVYQSATVDTSMSPYAGTGFNTMGTMAELNRPVAPGPGAYQ